MHIYVQIDKSCATVTPVSLIHLSFWTTYL